MRSLLIYEKIGAICPKDFFLVNSAPHIALSTPLEKAAEQCKTYGSGNPIFIIDPVDAIRGNEDSFNKAVIADMKNPVFLSSAPKGNMLLYANKLTRPIFERFRDKIKQADLIASPKMLYREGPYSGSDYFMCKVEEPLAHSILLNLTQLGLMKTESVPITDSSGSQIAYLAKVSGVDRTYDMHVTAKDLVRLVLPKGKNLEVRSILDFRDNHKNELKKFWHALAKQQKRLGEEDGQATNDGMFLDSRIEFQGLKDAIQNDWSALKWGLACSIVQLIIGVVFSSPGTVGTSPLVATAAGIRYAKRRLSTANFSYLLSIEEEL